MITQTEFDLDPALAARAFELLDQMREQDDSPTDES